MNHPDQSQGSEEKEERKTAEEVAALWIDGLTPCSTTNALNKLRLARDLKEYSNQELESLRKENEQLKYWKESEIKVWSDVLDYMHKRKDLEWGASISDYVLKFLKERDELRVEIKQLREALKELVEIVEFYKCGFADGAHIRLEKARKFLEK
jgi:hypothetical protein